MNPKEDGDFTTDSSSMDESLQSESNKEDLLLVYLVTDVGEPMLSTEEVENTKWKKDIIDKLMHLQLRACDEVSDTLEHLDILA